MLPACEAQRHRGTRKSEVFTPTIFLAESVTTDIWTVYDIQDSEKLTNKFQVIEKDMIEIIEGYGLNKKASANALQVTQSIQNP